MDKQKKLIVVGVTVFLCGLILGAPFLLVGAAANDWHCTSIGWFFIVAGILSAIGNLIYYTQVKELPEIERKKTSNTTSAACILIIMIAMTGFSGIKVTKSTTTPIDVTSIETELPTNNTITNATFQCYLSSYGKGVSSDSFDIPVGRILLIEISVSGVEDLYSWAFSMEWDPVILGLFQIIEGPFLASDSYETIFVYASSGSGSLQDLTDCRKGDTAGTSGNGVICWIRFLTKSSGTTWIYINDPRWIKSATLSKHSFPPIDPLKVTVTSTSDNPHDIPGNGGSAPECTLN